MKHTATVLEPSICFHTLVKHVDAEDVAKEKVRTLDRTLEVKHITKQLQTQTLDSSQQEQIMFTQPRDPLTRTNLHIKILLLLSLNKSFHLSLFQKQ